jgi:2-O-(6-phospho-alpha-D-mannosyl)-D-glycerate hydrolase
VADVQRTVYIVPHTHWDREWYEPFETFRAQLVELWDELLALTEADPDFRFLMDGQSVVIDDYLEIRPENRQRLQAAVERGQIQVGPWYTLPDEFLVSGETLVRDLERGLASASAHGGTMRVGYLPDSFGHAAQMPQLYRQFGFRFAAVWRGVPLSIDRVAFIWEGPDGSSVLTAYMGNSYSHGVDLPTDPEALTDRIRTALEAIEPFRPGRDILLMNGNDHVLPQTALSGAVQKASGRIDGTAIRLARLDDYLRVLPEAPWPHWRGELRSSARANVLMGTLSVRAPDKRLYARASRSLERLAEPAAALTASDMNDDLERAWTLVLQNAAHDTACGSGIDAVAEAARRRSEEVLNIAQRIVDRGLPGLAGEGEVWNPSPFPRQGVIDIGGKPVLTPVIPGCSSASLQEVRPPVEVAASRHRLENAFLAVDLKADGRLTVLDKARGVTYPDLGRLVDEGDAGDEYNYSPPWEPDPSFFTKPQGWVWSVLEDGPLRGRVELSFGMPIPRALRPDRRCRTPERVPMALRLRVTLAADSPRLDLELEVDNRSTDHRLRLHLPLPFTPGESAADTPFHVTRRPVLASHRDPGALEDELPTYPMCSFVDVSDGRVGLALITDGLHEYEVLPPPANELAITLLRAVGWLSRDDLATRTGHAGPELPTPGAQVLGAHHIRSSLFFHGGDWEQGGVWRSAESALVPLQLGHGRRTTPATRLIEFSPNSIQMTACIPGQDGYRLRILNASERSTQAVIRLRPVPSAVTATTLGGDQERALALAGEEARLLMRPWEIATLQVRR